MFFDTEDFRQSVLSYYEMFSTKHNETIYFKDFHSLFKQIESDDELAGINNLPELMDKIFKKYIE